MNNKQSELFIKQSLNSDLWSIRKTVERNELVSSLYSADNNLYYVEEGVIKVCCMKDDKEVILAFGLQGDLISDAFSFLTGEPSVLYLQAIKKTKLIGIPRKSFDILIEQDSNLARVYRKTLESKVVEILQRQTMFFSKSPKQRVEETLKLNPEIFRQVPRKYIALYLGIAPETMSRLIK